MEKLIFEIGDKYGPTGLILIIIVLLIWYGGNYMLKNIKKSNKEFSEQLSTSFADTLNKQNSMFIQNMKEQNDYLLEKLLEERIEHRNKEKQEHKDSQNRRIKVSPVVNKLINDLTNKLHCARTAVVEFCNGTSNVAGLSFMHYTIGYEWHQKGELEIPLHEKESLNSISPFIEKIHETSAHYVRLGIDYLHNINEDAGGFLNKFKPLHVQDAVLVGLYDDDNTISGILLFLYDNNFPLIDDLFDTEVIKEEAGKLSTLLFSNVYDNI